MRASLLKLFVTAVLTAPRRDVRDCQNIHVPVVLTFRYSILTTNMEISAPTCVTNTEMAATRIARIALARRLTRARAMHRLPVEQHAL